MQALHGVAVENVYCIAAVAKVASVDLFKIKAQLPYFNLVDIDKPVVVKIAD